MLPKIMGIINTSPDSFSGDGLEPGNDKALMTKLNSTLEQGADILDIGGRYR